MTDLSENKHVKLLCMHLCADRAHHEINLSRIDGNIKRRFIDNNVPINWNVVRTDCNELVRIYIEEYTRNKKVSHTNFRLKDKVGMATNILDYFRKKHNAPSDKHDDYIAELLDMVRDRQRP